jgi:hypothetical protein
MITTTAQRFEDLLQNPHLIKFYSNRKCKSCQGRGHRNLEVARGSKWVDKKVMCHCVKKAIHKEQRELQDG